MSIVVFWIVTPCNVALQNNTSQLKDHIRLESNLNPQVYEQWLKFWHIRRHKTDYSVKVLTMIHYTSGVYYYVGHSRLFVCSLFNDPFQ
jgi:hypothetical protein